MEVTELNIQLKQRDQVIESISQQFNVLMEKVNVSNQTITEQKDMIINLEKERAELVSVIAKQKSTSEMQKVLFENRLHAKEDKYLLIKNITLRLEREILELRSKLEAKK